MWQFIEQVSGLNIEVSEPIITEESSIRIICRKEMRHLDKIKNESSYSEIETGRKQMQYDVTNSLQLSIIVCSR